MKKVTWMLIFCNVAIFLVLTTKLNYPAKQKQESKPTDNQSVEAHTNISTKTPNFLLYNDLVEQLKTWKKEAPELVELGTYGKSLKNKDLTYLRICKNKNTDLPKVLITACIHGNEPLAASCVMAYIGNLLYEFESDKEVKSLILNRDLYFIPVVSPDSYPNNRLLGKIDPNRDFPTLKNPNHESINPVKELQDFFLKIKPDAVISGHTFGRVYLIPYGDSTEKCPNHDDYINLIGAMAKKSNYAIKPCCKLYKHPIFGTEIDWYYRNGAFAIVAEFGDHQKQPTPQQIKDEFERTWSSFKLFIKEAPQIHIKSGADFSLDNAGIEPEYFMYQKKVLGIKSLKN
jgi:hypothetical protein